MKSLLLLMLVFVSFSSASGQFAPKAQQVDEFGALGCDEFQGRADNFFVQLNKNPDAHGYFLIYGRNELVRGKIFWESELKAVAKERLSNPNQVEVIRGPEIGDFKGEFWLVPDGAEVPAFEKSVWNLSVSDSKAFVIAGGFGEVCHDTLDVDIVNEYLHANPKMIVRAVVYSRRRDRQMAEREARDTLRSMDRSRIQLAFAKPPKDYSGPIVEYWLVPYKNRRTLKNTKTTRIERQR